MIGDPSPFSFTVVLIAGLAISLAVMAAVAIHRARPPLVPTSDRARAVVALLSLGAPLGLLVGLLQVQSHDPLVALTILYGEGLYLDPSLEFGWLWLLGWVSLTLGPMVVGYGLLVQHSPGRAGPTFGRLMSYVGALGLYVLWGLYHRTTYRPLYLFELGGTAIRANDGLQIVFLLPFSIAAFAIGQSLYHRDSRLIVWTVLLWVPAVLHTLVLVWYTATRLGTAW